MKNVIIDTLLGGFVLGSISYMSALYSGNSIYFKILAFLWAMPLSFFFFLNMASRHGRVAMIDFTRHALIGTFLTLTLCSITLLFHIYMDDQTLVIMTLIFAIIFTMLYFINRIYKEI